MAARILVGLDGSEGSHLALEWAVEDAAARGVALDVVTVCRGGGDDSAANYFPFMTAHNMDVPAHVGADEARRRLLDAVEAVAAKHPEVETHAHVLQGDPAETLCRRAEHAGSLVVGARGHGTFASLLLGSVASKCARHGPGPVVIVPARRGGEVRPVAVPTSCIVVGIDDSAGSRAALRWAIEEAVARHRAIRAVTFWGRDRGGEPGSAGPADHDAERGAGEDLARVVEEVAGARPAVPIERVVAEGDPSQGLVELSRAADLLVVGSRGRGTFATLVLGSVAAKCAEHSLSPVAIVHGRPVAPDHDGAPARGFGAPS